MGSDSVQRQRQFPHHRYHRTPRLLAIPRFLGFIPTPYASLLNLTQRREIQPLSTTGTAPFADPQLPLILATTPLRQIQSHRLAVGWTRIEAARVARADPQHARSRHTHHLSLGLEHRLVRRQPTQLPLLVPVLPPRLQSLLG